MGQSRLQVVLVGYVGIYGRIYGDINDGRKEGGNLFCGTMKEMTAWICLDLRSASK